jgi:hypothetical protein
VTVHTGTSVMHNMDGKAITRDTGQSRLKVTFDDAVVNERLGRWTDLFNANVAK